jgi:O-antigen ligase
LKTRWVILVAVATLSGGLLATVSRGPWVGAAAMGLLLVLLGSNPRRDLARVLLIGVPACLVLIATPFGQKFVDVLPWVGTVDDFNVQYRQRLFDISLTVIGMNPWFGSPFYMSAPELQEMIQGEGIIDIVNSYIGIALAQGIVGLTLFVGVFAFALRVVWKAMRQATDHNHRAMGRGLLVSMAAVLIVIATVSSINAIPTLYWMLAGMCVAYGRLEAVGIAPRLHSSRGGIPAAQGAGRTSTR